MVSPGFTGDAKFDRFFPNKKRRGSSSFEPFPNHTSTSVFCVSVRVTSMARRFKQVWKNDLVQLTTGWFQRGVPAWLSSIRASIRGPWNMPGNVLKIWGEATKEAPPQEVSPSPPIFPGDSIDWACHPWMCLNVLFDPCNSKEKRGKVY